MITKTPSLTDVLQTAISSYVDSLLTILPCKVEAYDSTTQTADIKPINYQVVTKKDGTLGALELAVIPNVPVAFPRVGDWFISGPLAAGDMVLAVIASRDFQPWRETGDTTIPTDLVTNTPDLRAHPLNAAIAIPCNIYPKSAALASPDDSNMIIGKDTGAKVYIKPDAISLYEENPAEYIALAAKTDARISALETAFNTFVTAVYNSHTHGGVTTGPGTTATPAAAGSPVTPGSSVASAKVKST